MPKELDGKSSWNDILSWGGCFGAIEPDGLIALYSVLNHDPHMQAVFVGLGFLDSR